MRKILSLVLATLVSIAAFGQGFPVKINESYYDSLDAVIERSDLLKGNGRVISDSKLKERIESEGIPYTFTVRQIGMTALSTVVGDIISNSLMKAFYIKEMSLYSSHNATFTLTGGKRKTIGVAEFESVDVNRGQTKLISEGFFMRPNMDNWSLTYGLAVDTDPRLTQPQVTNSNANTNPNNLPVTKAGPTAVANSIRFTYTLTLTNSTGGSISGTTTIVETIPSGTRYISATGTGWTISESNGVLTCTTTDAIANNGTKVITVTLESKLRVTASLVAQGLLVDHDIDLDAPGIVWCGTSITAESSPTSYQTAYTYLIRNWLRDTRNVNTRVINRAVSGSSSVFHERARAFDGLYNFRDKVKAAIWEHGINDVAQAVSTATTIANLRAYIAHFRKTQGSSFPIFVFAAYPNGNSGNEASLVTLRAAIKADLISLNDPRVYYIESMGTLFNPATQSGTYTADGTHLNDAGNALVVTAFQNYITTNNIQF